MSQPYFTNSDDAGRPGRSLSFSGARRWDGHLQGLIISVVVSTIAGAALQAAGMSLGVVLLGSFIAPPASLLAFRLARYKGWV